MTEPIYTDAMERLYVGLPEVYRREDEDQDWQLKKFLSGVVDQLNDIEVLTDRIDYQSLPEGVPGDTSDLVDPYAADPQWLRWLAQVVGLQMSTLPNDVDALRDRIAAPSKFQAGTKAALQQAAKAVLTGEQHIEVYDHTTDISPLGGATQWDVLIVTRATETLSDPTDEIIRVGAKPAGVILYHRTYTTTWDAIEAAFPTWADMEGKTWNEIEEAGL